LNIFFLISILSFYVFRRQDILYFKIDVNVLVNHLFVSLIIKFSTRNDMMFICILYIKIESRLNIGDVKNEAALAPFTQTKMIISRLTAARMSFINTRKHRSASEFIKRRIVDHMLFRKNTIDKVPSQFPDIDKNKKFIQKKMIMLTRILCRYSFFLLYCDLNEEYLLKEIKIL
jgi:hypothetical protein